jgi:hypothetical protein
MTEPSTFDALRAFDGQSVKLQCGNCPKHNQLDTLIAVVSGDVAFITGMRVPDDRLPTLGPGDLRAKRARTGKGGVEVRYLGGDPRRREWRCLKCDRPYQRNLTKTKLIDAFMEHAESGEPLILTS